LTLSDVCKTSAINKIGSWRVVRYHQGPPKLEKIRLDEEQFMKTSNLEFIEHWRFPSHAMSKKEWIEYIEICFKNTHDKNQRNIVAKITEPKTGYPQHLHMFAENE
jgi:hypothetical protein